jgi:hypothetical protein
MSEREHAADGAAEAKMRRAGFFGHHPPRDKEHAASSTVGSELQLIACVGSGKTETVAQAEVLAEAKKTTGSLLETTHSLFGRGLMIEP